MLPYLHLGPFLLPMASLALLVGVWLGSWLAEKEAVHQNIRPELISNLVLLGLVAGLVGARLGYAIHYLSAYLARPLDLISLTPGTLSPGEGLLAGVLAAGIYGQRKGMPLRPVLDALAPGLAGFLVFLGAAHLLSGDAYGAPSRLPWAIFQWGDYRQPTQAYEILLAAGIFLAAWKRPLEKRGSGLNFWLVAALSAAARVFLEAFRGDSLIWAGGFRAAQAIGLLVLGLALWFLWDWGVRSKQEAPERHETALDR